MEANVMIENIYKIFGVGIVVVGQVTKGILRIGYKIGIDGNIMEIKSIEAKHKQLVEAREGMNIGFALKNGDKQLLEKIKGKEVVFAEQVNPEPELI